MSSVTFQLPLPAGLAREWLTITLVTFANSIGALGITVGTEFAHHLGLLVGHFARIGDVLGTSPCFDCATTHQCEALYISLQRPIEASEGREALRSFYARADA